MHVTNITGVKPRWDDDELTRCLRQCNNSVASGEPMSIGIRNEGGLIYKAIGTLGSDEYMGVVECLDSLGFRDELGKPGGWFDAIFSKM
jgi:hypothetical protein